MKFESISSLLWRFTINPNCKHKIWKSIKEPINITIFGDDNLNRYNCETGFVDRKIFQILESLKNDPNIYIQEGFHKC